MGTQMKSILFATDGSEFSAGAQRLAIALAKRCGARLTVMTIILSPQDLVGFGTHGLREQMEREAQALLATVVAAAETEGVPCLTQLVYGDQPHQEIINTALELEPDLIVLGRRGKRGLARLMVGHATAHVAGLAPCPVLMVPRAATLWSHRILLATDGSDHGKAAAQVALDLARDCQLPVTLVSATTRSHGAERKAEAQAALEQLLVALKAAGIEGEAVLADGRPDQVVIETANDRQADLIVVGSHGRGGLGRLLLGSVSERIMGQAQCAVVIVPGSH
ncbi:MAG: universal stress protein [Chromatiaceae bacterium]